MRVPLNTAEGKTRLAHEYTPEVNRSGGKEGRAENTDYQLESEADGV